MWVEEDVKKMGKEILKGKPKELSRVEKVEQGMEKKTEKGR